MRDTSSDSDPQPEPKKDELDPQDKWYWEHTLYEELRKLAGAKLAQEKPGQTLQATALVHEAYLRLVEVETAQSWKSRGHFFAAAAEAMRRVLVDNARRKKAHKHGGHLERQTVDLDRQADSQQAPDILAIDQALEKLALESEVVAKLVELKYFAGLSIDDAARAVNLSPRTAYRYWAYAKAWLRDEILGDGEV